MGFWQKLKGSKKFSTGKVVSGSDSEKLQKIKKVLENHMRDIDAEKKRTLETTTEYNMCKILLKLC